MKKFFALLMAIFALALALAACDDGNSSDNGNGNGNGGNNDDVIGTWAYYYTAVNMNVGVIKLDVSNGSWVLAFTDLDANMASYNGTWKRNGNTLTLTDSASSSKISTASLSGNELILSHCYPYNLRPNTCSLSNYTPSGNSILAISNQSGYELFEVEYNSVDFGPIRIGWEASEKVDSGTKYIYFTLILPPKTFGDGAVYARCRTTNAVTCEENVRNTFVFTNNTVIKTVDINPEKEGTLGNIANELSQ